MEEPRCCGSSTSECRRGGVGEGSSSSGGRRRRSGSSSRATALTTLLACSMGVVHGFHVAAPLPSSPTCRQPSGGMMRMSTAAASVPAPSPRENERISALFRKPLKIGFMVEPTPFTHVSGYSNRYQETFKYLKKVGDVCEIVTTDDVPDAPTVHQGYGVHYTPGFRFPLYKHICLSPDIKLIAYNIMRVFKPSVLHVASPGFFAIISTIYARLLRIPLVMSYHTHLPIYARDYMGFIPGIVGLTKMVIKFFHNMADLTLVTSPQLKEEMEGWGIKRIGVWRKGIDTQKFNPLFKSSAMRSRLTDGHPESPLLLYVGRLGAEKKLKTLRGVLDRLPNARLAFVGTGPAEDDLKAAFEGTNTVFTGLLRGEELSQAFASADVFLMPSDSETLGFVVLESMASGVPVVGANAGGIPNLIDEGKTGYLVPVGDEAAFADRVQAFLNNPQHYQEAKKAARQEAERWDWESATLELRNVHYKTAVQNFHARWSLGGMLQGGMFKRRPEDPIPAVGM